VFDRSFNGSSFDAHDGPVRCCQRRTFRGREIRDLERESVLFIGTQLSILYDGSALANHLRRRPSSLGLDHGWCVYSKLGKTCCRPPSAFAEAQRHFTVCTLKKRQLCSQHFSGVHIVSLPLGLHVLVSRSIHTHKHVRTYNYAPIRDTSSLKTAPRSLPT
jgi:hypothetical protein